MRDKKGRFIKGHEVLPQWREKASIVSKGNTYRKGSIHTEEAKEKNRSAHLGIIAWNKGKTCLNQRGKNHWNWKGGICLRDNKTIEYKEWRKKIFERDNHTCQICLRKKEVSGKLQAHHLYYYSEIQELRYSLKNGITYCKSCHAKLHRKNIRIDKIFASIIQKYKDWIIKEYKDDGFIIGQNI